MASMLAGGMVTPSLAMKRKPWVHAAERTCWAVSAEELDMSITGISEDDILKSVRGVLI